MNTAQSLVSPVLEYASSFNRFDYFLVYISLTPVCFPSYQATTVWWRADVMYRMPSTLMLFPGNEQEMQARVMHSHVMFPFQSFWWGIWTRAKIIRPTLTVCSGINSMYTQRSVEALIFGFVCFQVPVAFSKEKHVCSEISQGCCAIRPPYLWFISQMGLLSLPSPSVCSLSYDSTSLPFSPLLFFNLMFYSLHSCSAFFSYLFFSIFFNLANISLFISSFLFYLNSA